MNGHQPDLSVVEKLGEDHRDKQWVDADGWKWHWLDHPLSALKGRWRADRVKDACTMRMTLAMGTDPDELHGPFTEVNDGSPG